MVRIKVFDLRQSPESGALDDSSMEAFLADKDVISCTDHLVVHREELHLILVVTYRELSGETQRARGGPRKDWRATLNPDDAATYDRLRAWRNEKAKAEGVPPYLVFNNRQLAEMARRQPSSLTGLREIEGVGPASCEKYGAEALTVLGGRSATDEPGAENTATARGGEQADEGETF